MRTVPQSRATLKECADGLRVQAGILAASIRQFLGRFSLDSLCMYGLAVISELPVLFIRTVIVWTVAFVVLLLLGSSTDAAGRYSEIALIPTLFSALALFTPAGAGWWWMQCIGGREPSKREQLAYQDAVDQLAASTQTTLPLPASWFVIDVPTPEAAVCGDTLMLSRGLLESTHLPAVIAHELGHLASPDGRLAAALNRLVLNPPRLRPDGQYERPSLNIYDPRLMVPLFGIRTLTWIFKNALAFANGGFGLRITQPLWGAYWRAREYHADQYAATLGQAEDLADFLEAHALAHDHPVPYIWLTDHTHPPVELRIERLRSATEDSQQTQRSTQPLLHIETDDTDQLAA